MDRKNVVIIILVVLLAALLAGGGVYLWQSGDDGSDQATVSDESTQTDETTAADEAITLTQGETADQTTSTANDEEVITQAIVQAMADKYSKDVSDVDLNVSEIDGDYATGSVSFSGQMGGGWFLAAKDSGGQWVIVADGNGTILCSDIAPYDFPVSMVPECYDDATGTIVTR